MPVSLVQVFDTLCGIAPEYGGRVWQTALGPEPRTWVLMERVERDIVDGASSDVENDLDWSVLNQWSLMIDLL